MKKHLLTVILLLAISNIFSQSYSISFSAVAPEGTVTYDSIQVYNLTENIHKTLYYGDLLLLGNLGVNQISAEKESLQLFPNPSNGSTQLSFFIQTSAKTVISIYDITGREIITYSGNLNIGRHKFNINGLNEGMFLINVSNKDINYTTKLLSQSKDKREAHIDYIENIENKTAVLKNTTSDVNLNFSDGDLLLFKAYHANYSKIVTDIPASSKNINFIFWQCKDAENNNYTTVDIGNRTWMAENLKTLLYRNGDSIPNILTELEWTTATKGAYCDYNNNPVNDSIYGKLYNHYTTTDIRNLCPQGWKMPNDSDWNSLISYLGGDLIAGGKLKETESLHWLNNAMASNASGFTALPGGSRNNLSGDLGIYGLWWSATIFDQNNSYFFKANNANDNITRDFSQNYSGMSLRCIKDTSNSLSFLPTLTTIPVTNVTISTATSGGNITNFGGNAIVSRGLCYSTSSNPTIDDSTVYLSGPSGTGVFTGNITGLTGSTTYYVRAFAVNAFSVAYGNQVTFTTQLPANGGLTDIEGNVYDTIVIGTQVWMRQNLKVAKYNNGDSLPQVTANAAWAALTSGAYCNYGNNASTIYGKLYNWYAVTDSRNLCPINWHVATDADWNDLITYLGGGSIAGGKLKEVDTIMWAFPNADATNSSGFTAFAGGSRSETGAYNDLGYYGGWWSTYEYDLTKGVYMGLSYGNGSTTYAQRYKKIGYSVRCVKNPIQTITDIEGNVYDTLQIGSQIWMKQNLKTKHYNNGDLIPTVSDSAQWLGLTSGAYCDYNNDSNQVAENGRLYNFYVVSDTRNVCPVDWHVPANSEWNTLINYLGGDSVAGGKLKEAGLSHWFSPNTAATNEIGFTALPSGYRNSDYANYQGMSYIGSWWASSEVNALIAYCRVIRYDFGKIDSQVNYYKRGGMSIRCVKD